LKNFNTTLEKSVKKVDLRFLKVLYSLVKFDKSFGLERLFLTAARLGWTLSALAIKRTSFY